MGSSTSTGWTGVFVAVGGTAGLGVEVGVGVKVGVFETVGIAAVGVSDGERVAVVVGRGVSVGRGVRVYVADGTKDSVGTTAAGGMVVARHATNRQTKPRSDGALFIRAGSPCLQPECN